MWMYLLQVKEGDVESKQSSPSDKDDTQSKEQQRARAINELEAMLQERDEEIKKQKDTITDAQV